MRINEILTEKFAVTTEIDKIARFHVKDYYSYLENNGVINHNLKVIDNNSSLWNYNTNLNASLISDQSSNFYVLANNISLKFRLEHLDGYTKTYSNQLDVGSQNKSYEANFDTDDYAINITLDPVLLLPEEKHLQYKIYRILIHEITHVYQYASMLSNYDLEGKWPENNKKYELKSYEIDARYREGWANVFYSAKLNSKIPTLKEVESLILDSITRRSRYKIPNNIIYKYKKKIAKDYNSYIADKE